MFVEVLTGQVVGTDDGAPGVDQVADAPRVALFRLHGQVGRTHHLVAVGQQAVWKTLLVGEVLLRLDGIEAGADDHRIG